MYVKSWEEGERPSAWTTGRQYAPAAAFVLTEILSQQDWGDYGFVVIDWTGLIATVDETGTSYDRQNTEGDLPPVLYVQVAKAMPEMGGTMVAEHNIDIDSVFVDHEATRDDLAQVVLQLKQGIFEGIEQRKKGM